MGLHMPEIIALVVILLLVFGPKKLPKMGNDIGKGIREFKKGIDDVTSTDNSSNNEKISSQKSLSSARAELDQIERDLAYKKAQLAEKEAEKTAANGQSVS
jgi:twin arginine-targeting protein translocase, TatA/E family